jgi:hypothetical protein
LWLDLLDLLSCDTVAAARVRRALHVDSFNPADVRRFCMPWILDPFCFLSAFLPSVYSPVCSVLACYVVLVAASVADAAVPAGERVFAAGLVHSCLSPVSYCPALPPLLPPLRVCRGRSPSGVRRGPRFAVFFNFSFSLTLNSAAGLQIPVARAPPLVFYTSCSVG